MNFVWVILSFLVLNCQKIKTQNSTNEAISSTTSIPTTTNRSSVSTTLTPGLNFSSTSINATRTRFTPSTFRTSTTPISSTGSTNQTNLTNPSNPSNPTTPTNLNQTTSRTRTTTRTTRPTSKSTTNDSTNNSSNESDNSSSSSSEDSSSNSQEFTLTPFAIQFQQITCLNNQLLQFLQLGIAFNDNLLQCTSSLTNLGSDIYNRVTDYNQQFDDLSTSYALFMYCPTNFCRFRQAINLIADVAQIAADLNAIQDGLIDLQTASTSQASTTIKNVTSNNINSNNATSRMRFGNGATVLNRSERNCVTAVVNNAVNVFNNISTCVYGSG